MRLALPPTREKPGDAAGLTAMHVNRPVRLRDEGPIEQDDGSLHIPDPAALRRAAGFDPAYPHLD